MSNNLKLLEHVIRHKFVKSVLNGYECNDTERKLFTYSTILSNIGKYL